MAGMTARRTESALSTPWYLVGLPGSGKSKVGALLAELLRVPHIDIDAQIEREQGKSISQIFTEEGESTFRALEAEATLATVGARAVVSLGGGAIETASVRDYLSDQTVVWIDADLGLLSSRVRRNDRRPLLAVDPEQKLKELARRRNPLFQSVADVKVRSTAGSVHVVVQDVLRGLRDWDYVTVRSTRPYPVFIGSSTSTLLTSYLPRGASRAMLVVPESLTHMADSILSELEEAGLEGNVFVHPDGERAKNSSVLASAWDQLGAARLGRADVIITLGGGVTSDLGGFVAATWLRGIEVVHLPTTLLAMVDAAVGGKTGIDTAAGKNLVGAFHDPKAVLVDLDRLRSLPREEFISGLAEVIKTGLIDDPKIIDAVAANPQLGDVGWATGPGLAVLRDLVHRSIAVKARVVGNDRLEAGLRETLNYGHTMGHAIERAENYRMRHGEAVAIGAVFAARLAEELGIASRGTAAAHEKVFAAVGLPTTYSGDLDVVMEAITADKKVRQGQLRFVLLQEDGTPTVRAVKASTVRLLAERMGMGQ